MTANHVEVINGSRTSFGPRDAETRLATTIHTAGAHKQLVLPVKFDALLDQLEDDVTGAGLPENAVVTRIQCLVPNEDFEDGTNYEIKLVEEDGTDIHTLATVTTDNLNDAEDVSITNAVVTTGPAYVQLDETGTYTAGAGYIVVEYIEQPHMFL